MLLCAQTELKLMSPSPDRFPQPPNHPLPDETSSPDKQSPAVSDSALPDATAAKGAALDRASELSAESSDSSDAAAANAPSPLVPKRPLMRPVSRPQPPSPPPAAAPKPVEVVSISPKSEVPPAQAVASVTAAPISESEAVAGQAIIRQQPIPPPSEPKQYRAIGLVRGRYTPSEAQFTRGAMVTSDGTEIEAVLLGRVMSLVRNHLDLEQEHLWVVYPRTREMRQDLHVQIVGVWEPERLNKNAEDEAQSPESSQAEAVAASVTDDPGFDENYFSIRGEIVFYSAEEQQIVVKIQQAPRKTADREKAFKLRLDGVLNSPKALGYFWDLHVERRAAALVVTTGTPIGLVPPKKKTASTGLKRGGDRRSPQRRVRPSASGARSAGATGAPRREPIPKPVKRSAEQSGEG